MKEPIKVVVTGAGGRSAYCFLHSLCSGSVLGKDQPIILRLHEIKRNLKVAKSVAIELKNCEFPLVQEYLVTSIDERAYTGATLAVLMTGHRPTQTSWNAQGREELIRANTHIYFNHARALEDWADQRVRVVVVGDPVNTNAFIIRQFAPKVAAENITGLVRLEANRTQAQLASRLGVSCGRLFGCTVWGNNSRSLHPDARHTWAYVPEGDKILVSTTIREDAFFNYELAAAVHSRGNGERNDSMSAGKALGDHLRDWWQGTKEGWCSMAVVSDGSYKVPEGLVFSFPVEIMTGDSAGDSSSSRWRIISDLKLDSFLLNRIEVNINELVVERFLALEICEELIKNL